MKKDYSMIRQLTILLFLMICLNGCWIGPQDKCECLHDAVIGYETVPQDLEKFNSSVEAEFYFKPYIVPFKLVYSSETGVSFKYDKDVSIPVYIGEVGVNVEVKSAFSGIRVEPSDFMIAIVDRKKNTKQVYKVEGSKRLYAELKGGDTKVYAEAGILELDVTNTVFTEFVFYDVGKYRIVNATPFMQKFKVTKYFDFTFEKNNYKSPWSSSYSTGSSTSYDVLDTMEISCIVYGNTYKEFNELDLMYAYQLDNVNVAIHYNPKIHASTTIIEGLGKSFAAKEGDEILFVRNTDGVETLKKLSHN